jgi:hypothetical protein
MAKRPKMSVNSLKSAAKIFVSGSDFWPGGIGGGEGGWPDAMDRDQWCNSIGVRGFQPKNVRI